MDANERAPRGGEISMSEKKGGEVVVAISEKKGGEVVVAISGEEESTKVSRVEANGSSSGLAKSAPPVSCPSPEIKSFSSSPNKPPKVPTTETLTRRRSFAKSPYSKSKSRFGEPSPPIDSNLFEQEQLGQALYSPRRKSSNQASPNNTATVPMTPKAPTVASPGGAGEDENEEIYKKVKLSHEKHNRITAKFVIEWVAFICIVTGLVASLTVHKLQHTVFWGLEIWKWCVLIMVIFCGMLVTHWLIQFIVFLIERNFLLRKKVLYFVHGLKKSVQVCIWLNLVLVTWVLLFNRGVRRSLRTTKILDYVTWTIVSILIGSFLWLLKTLLLKILASSFHVNTFFDRIQESVFYQYVLQTLSGPPVMERAAKLGRTTSTGHLSFRSTKKGKLGKEKEMIDIEKLHRMKQEKVSAWDMKVLIDVIASSGLSTISNTLDDCELDGGGEQTDKEITNEMEAIAAAYHIFKNVAQDRKFIEADDLLRFMIKEEVEHVFPLIEGAETGRIDRTGLTEWVVKVYKGRKALAHALNDTKTAVNQLNKLVTGILIVVIILVWLLLMEIATTKVLVFLSSQLVVAAFMFGNTCKTIFEAIIFVFVMHPFDVGDRCMIDGVQMVVEEMNILTTVFLKFDNEKMYYPNSVLATKAIGNFYRSPDMVDTVEFSIDVMTPVERIGELKDRIKNYLENNSQHWHPNHSVVVREIENVNKMKMALFVNHTMNFQNFAEKNKRRTELVMEMKKFFEELSIKYNLLPQEVHLSYVGPATTTPVTIR